MVVKSEVTGKYYSVENTVRIVRWKQVVFYMNKGIVPKDIFVSIDRKTGEDILVFLFDKDESRETYYEWRSILDHAKGYEQK